MSRKILGGGRIPIRLWVDQMEDGAMKQARNLSNLPFAFRHVAIMPDCHEGFGMPIGGVLATTGVIIPNAVGVDIGCGMCAVKTSLRSIERDAPAGRQRSLRGKPLRLFPGTVISAAGTSQTCPQCGRNPIAALRAGPAKIRVDEGGRVKVRDGLLCISRVAAAPLAAGPCPLDEVLRHAKAGLRRSDPARTRRETTQSRYHCLYSDCGCEGHADEFAAVNIGRKFLIERLVQQSQDAAVPAAAASGPAGTAGGPAHPQAGKRPAHGLTEDLSCS